MRVNLRDCANKTRSAARSLIAIGAIASLAVSGCSATGLFGSDPFATSGLAGKQILLQIPAIDGARPYLTVKTTIGGKSLNLLVDTGSPGIRLIDGAPGTSALTRTDTPVQGRFVDGTILSGVQVSAPVTIGDLSTSGPINIQLITSVACDQGSPNCVGAHGLAEFRKTQPFDGILGIGLMNSPEFNPLEQLTGGSASSFTIYTQPGGTSAMLTLDQEPSSINAQYQMPSEAAQANGVPAWSSNEAPGCWAFYGQQPQCVATSFDTGSPFTMATNSMPGAPATGQAAAGTVLGLFTQDFASVWTLTSGDAPGQNQMVIANGDPAVNTGLAIFRSQAVTFDIKAGRVILSNH